MTHRRTPRGSVLIVTLVVVFALAGMVLALGRNARVEATASANSLAIAEADAIARGAEQYVLALLSERRDELDQLTDDDFAAVPVGRGWFWILKPDFENPDNAAFGLMDETARLDINTATVDMLRRMPGMTEELATSILDWRDEDDESTEGGAESSYYLTLTPPYSAKNAPFESVAELRLVYGMTADLYRGARAAVGSTAGRALFSEGYQERGLTPYCTVWARSSNLDANDQPRINLADAQQRQPLENKLREKLGQTRGQEVINRLGPRPPTNLFDLAQRGGLSSDEIRQIETDLTDANGRQLRGRINVNAAPREVLMCLEGLDEARANQLIAARPGTSNTSPASVAWVWDTLQGEAVGLGSQITGQGEVYSARILATSGAGRALKRVRIVVDAGVTPVRVIYREVLPAAMGLVEAAVLADWRGDMVGAGSPLEGGVF